METLQEIESRIAALSEVELAQFRQWYAQFDASAWDAQFEGDARAGRFDGPAQEAIEEYRAGECKPL